MAALGPLDPESDAHALKVRGPKPTRSPRPETAALGSGSVAAVIGPGDVERVARRVPDRLRPRLTRAAVQPVSLIPGQVGVTPAQRPGTLRPWLPQNKP